MHRYNRNNPHPFRKSLFLRGKKERTLLEVHNKLVELDAKRLILIAKSRDWFSRCPDKVLGTIVTRPTITEDSRQIEVIYNLDHKLGSYSKSYPNRETLGHLLTMRDIELPLHMNSDLDERSMGIIKDRLSGKITEIPIRQDLVDEREAIDHKFDSLWQLIGGYQKLLTDYMRKMVQLPKNPVVNTTTLATLEVGGTTHYFKVDSGACSFSYISRTSVVNIKGDKNDTL